MRVKIAFLLLCSVVFTAECFAFTPKSMSECRFAFLGMRSATFIGMNPAARELFEKISREVARDLGADDAELTTEKWRDRVQAAFLACFDPAKSIGPFQVNDCLRERFGPNVWERFDLVSAYAAGAYAVSGTPSGFQLTSHMNRTGYYLLVVIKILSSLSIDCRITPGLPGNFVITLSGAG